ncbi:helix-turn-helix domain-containing protein [uncultured Dubosiella sp.]|uniref:helix-turn-helix domain-containing protein n=1 Tax=uncultured Dubosiella sp. TaxID=1937011 RepID=UPI0026375D38|nr:helix-turn-helix transcriptional regulator [uncultured Dubosiella sp.]
MITIRLEGWDLHTIIDYKLIGTRIRNRRKELKLTQEELAEKAQITPFYLSKIENGKSSPTLETIAVLANELDTDLTTIISGVSTINNNYVDKRLSDICNSASDAQLDLIIKISKLILDA